MDEMIFAALHVLLAYQGHSFEREEPRYFQQEIQKLMLRLVGDMKGGDGFDIDDEYARFRRRQRIHRMHLVGYAVSAALVLIGMLLFWH